MGTVKMSIYDWRDMVRVCGTLSTNKGDRESLRYIDLCINDESKGLCTAYGCNGYQMSRVKFMCEVHDIPWKYHFLIDIFKAPVGSCDVVIEINEDDDEYSVTFLNKTGEKIVAFSQDIVHIEPMNYERFFENAHKNFDEFNHGEGKYWIAVNPKYLLNALEGLKQFDNVILNFGTNVQPFSIRDGNGSMKVEALVLPVRKL